VFAAVEDDQQRRAGGEGVSEPIEQHRRPRSSRERYAERLGRHVDDLGLRGGARKVENDGTMLRVKLQEPRRQPSLSRSSGPEQEYRTT
jgi:hypothetical protein